MIQESW